MDVLCDTGTHHRLHGHFYFYCALDRRTINLRSAYNFVCKLRRLLLAHEDGVHDV